MIKRFTVTGNSMEPTYHDGDVIIVRHAAHYKKNDVVVCHDPRSAERTILKRVQARTLDSYEILGDNPRASTDSRSFGAVQKEHIIGKVILA